MSEKGSLHPPTLRDVVYSSKAFLASALALMVGFSQNLENPYWSVLTVYIISNPPGAGAIRAKCLFRLFGTVIGGVLVVALTGVFGDQIGILLVATIAMIVGATFLNQIDKTPANYLWFAVAVTGAVIALSNLQHPDRLFNLATARVGEILLGILMVAAVDCLWPEPMTPSFLKTLADWRGQARDFAIETISLTDVPATDEDRRGKLNDLIKGIQAIDGKAVQLPFDVVPMAPRGRDLDLVRRQVVASIGDLISIELRARPLREAETIPLPIDGFLKASGSWLRAEPDISDPALQAHVDEGRVLADDIEAAREDLAETEERVALLERGFLSRLAVFLNDWCDLLLALRAVETGGRLPPRLEKIAARAKPVRSVDYLAVALDVLPMAVAMTVASLIWYLTAWDSGPTSLLFSFAGCFVIVGQEEIAKPGGGLLVSVLAAFALVLVYQFAVLPRVTDFPVLIMVLGCALLPLGILMAMNALGFLVIVLTMSFLGLQNAYHADFAQSLQTLSGCLVGFLIAVVCNRVCSYDHARFAMRRLVAAVRRDVVDIARAPRLPRADRFRFLALYRLSLYFPAAQKVADGKPLPHAGLLRDLVIGQNLLTLRRREATASSGVQDRIMALRDMTLATFERKTGGRDDTNDLQAGVQAAMQDPAVRADPARDTLLDALSGLHLALSGSFLSAREAPAR